MNQTLGFPRPEVSAGNAEWDVHTTKLGSIIEGNEIGAVLIDFDMAPDGAALFALRISIVLEQTVNFLVVVQAVVEEEPQFRHFPQVLAHAARQDLSDVKCLSFYQCKSFGRLAH